MTEDSAPREPPHIREAKRAATRTSAISLAVIWVLVATLDVFDVIKTHSHGHTLSPFFWIGVAALVFLAGSIVSVWRRLSTRYPKL